MRWLIASALVASSGIARAQECTPPRVLIVLDQSSSMNYTIDDTPKWDIAVSAIGDVLGEHGDSIDFGLMLFPWPNECSPGSVVVEPGAETYDTIRSQLGTAPPVGGNYTPMAQSLEAAAAYAPMAEAGRDTYVLLITDGWQWCDPYDPATRYTPVAAVDSLNAIGVTTYIVGFGDGVDVLTLNRMAEASETSLAGCDPDSEAIDGANCYYQADSDTALVAALEEITLSITEEVCDGVDNDCNGATDEDLTIACTTDCVTGTSTVGTAVCSDGTWSDCDAECRTGGEGEGEGEGEAEGEGETPNPDYRVWEPEDQEVTGTVVDDGADTAGGFDFSDGDGDSTSVAGGCGCRTSASTPPALAPLLALLVMAAGSRRRAH